MRKWEKVKYEGDIVILGLGALGVMIAGFVQGFRASDVVLAACFLALALVKAFTYVAREKQMGGRGRKKSGQVSLFAKESKGGVNDPPAIPHPNGDPKETGASAE